MPWYPLNAGRQNAVPFCKYRGKVWCRERNINRVSNILLEKFEIQVKISSQLLETFKQSRLEFEILESTWDREKRLYLKISWYTKVLATFDLLKQITTAQKMKKSLMKTSFFVRCILKGFLRRSLDFSNFQNRRIRNIWLITLLKVPWIWYFTRVWNFGVHPLPKKIF